VVFAWGATGGSTPSTSARAISSPDFLKISPNNKIPALVDPNGPDGKPISLFESGAILLYLASKTASSCPSPTGKFEVLQWLMFQMGGVAPCWGRHTTSAFTRPKRSSTR
jgi:glutathione S-transferase